MKVPEGIETVEFKVVDVFKNEQIQTKRNNEIIETKIDELRLNKGSQLVLFNSNISTVIKSSPGSKLKIEKQAAFNNESRIEITISSLIEFGSSTVVGLCKEIKLTDFNGERLQEEENELIAPMICGSNFDCNAWKDQFIGNDQYPFARCVKVFDQVCLSASNNSGAKDRGVQKKPLSAGSIAGIVITIVVLFIAVVVLLVLYIMKTRKTQIHSNNENTELNAYNEDVSVMEV